MAESRVGSVQEMHAEFDGWAKLVQVELRAVPRSKQRKTAVHVEMSLKLWMAHERQRAEHGRGEKR